MFDFEREKIKMTKVIQQFLCCDVNTRLSADVMILLKESNTLLQLQKCYISFEERQKSLLNELEKKMKVLHLKKIEVLPSNSSNVAIKINEFKGYIRLIWENAKEHLMQKSSRLKYLSKEGLPILSYIHKLTAFTEHVYSNYYHVFVHPQCCSTFLQLSNQISNVLHPDLSQADIFEQNLAFKMWTVSFLTNLISMIDLYTCSNKLDILAFYTELISEESINNDISISKESLPSMLLCSLLKGELLEEGREIETNPIVEDTFSKFYKVMIDISQYLFNMTTTTARIKITTSQRYKGCLDAPYAKPVPPGVSISSIRGTPGFRGRGRTPRGTYSNRMIERSERTLKSEMTTIRVSTIVNTYHFPNE